MSAKLLSFAASALAGGALTFGALAQAQTPAPTPRSAPPPAPVIEPLIKDAHWHHIHLAATDPAASIAFYTKHFDAKAARFADVTDAVWTQKSWMLFRKVDAPPTKKLNTAIWHFGWGTEDPKAEFERQKSLGATFFAPLTDITDMVGRPFYYMYVQGPDRALIELNTASHHRFGHLHLFSKDPIAAGDWYIKTFGVRGRYQGPDAPRTVRMYQNNQIGPSANLNFDNVNMIIYPVEYSKYNYADDWKGVSEIQPTRGSVNDHVGFSVPNLTDALAKLRAAGVKVTAEPREGPQGKFRYAFIEGPDQIAIELIEDHSGHPPIEN